VAADDDPVPVEDRYSTGSLKSVGFTLDGEMHGAWSFYRLDGSVMRSGEFDRGHQVGVWRTFDRTGRLVKATDFGTGAGRSRAR
jgi:antitoxin component YwqK of YwqJK toxin-antitoxin module